MDIGSDSVRLMALSVAKEFFNKRDIGKVIFYSLEDVSETLGDVVVITE